MKNEVFALLVLSVCSVGGVKFYLPKLIDAQIRSRLDSAIADVKKQNERLSEIVKNLESRQQNLENSPSEHKVTSNFKVDFRRWDCWCNLRSKLCYGDDYSKELAEFRKIFSAYPDLLKKVSLLTLTRSNETKNDSLVNRLLKFVRMRTVNENELDRITGYVMLLSIRKVEAYE